MTSTHFFDSQKKDNKSKFSIESDKNQNINASGGLNGSCPNQNSEEQKSPNGSPEKIIHIPDSPIIEETEPQYTSTRSARENMMDDLSFLKMKSIKSINQGMQSSHSSNAVD